MPAIMEPTTDNLVPSNILSPLTFPSLAYDKATTNIAATVLVTSDPKSTDPIFRVPPITIVGPAEGESLPTWTVTWDFTIDPSLQGHEYDIQIPAEGTSLPPSSPVTVQKKQAGIWAITFIKADVTLPFSYDIVEKTTGSKQQFVEDPTIVVTPDPII